MIVALLAALLLLVCNLASSAAINEWSIRPGSISDHSLLPDGGLVLAVGNMVANFDVEGRQRWQWAADSPVTFVAADKGGAVVATYGSTLVKLDAAGKLLWASDTYDKAYSLAIMEGGIFVGWEYGLMKYDMSGTLVWEYYRPEDC